VTKITFGMGCPPSRLLSARQASTPSIFGICMSIRTRSKGCLASISTASKPLLAMVTIVTPHRFRSLFMTFWFTRLSSAINILSPEISSSPSSPRALEHALAGFPNSSWPKSPKYWIRTEGKTSIRERQCFFVFFYSIFRTKCYQTRPGIFL